MLNNTEIIEAQPDTLQIFAVENIKSKDVPPGTAAPASQAEKQDQAIEEASRLIGRYVEAHPTKSTWVTEADVPLVMEDGKDMMIMCSLPRGLAASAKAIAHSQISTKPLRFFIFPNGKAIINPVITSHTKAYVYRDNEGCMTYPHMKARNFVPRFNKIDVTYQTLVMDEGETTPRMSAPITETLNGEHAHIFQHECDHLNGGYVYDKDYTPERAAWLGEGEPETKPLWTFAAPKQI